MPMIYLIRHAQASFGSADYDVLSDTGHRQAALLDDELVGRGVRPSVVMSGTLRRQLDTAVACTASIGIAPAQDARWNEYDSAGVVTHHAAMPLEAPPGSLGAAPGMSSRDFQPLLDDALRSWIAAGESSAAPESWPAFRERSASALRELAAGLSSGNDAAVFSSGGTIAVVAAFLLGAGPETFIALNRMAVNAGISKVMVGRTGTQLLSYNEQAHIQREPGVMTFR